jgi:general secretion pathway protein G
MMAKVPGFPRAVNWHGFCDGVQHMNENLSPDDGEPNDVPGKINWIRIMWVIFLAIILAGMVLPRYRVGKRARVTAASAQIAILGSALEAFNIDNGHFPLGTNGLVNLTQRPSDATNWHGPYLVGPVPQDPWRQPYVYKCPGRHNPQSFDLSSMAPDGEEICNWKKQ